MLESEKKSCMCVGGTHEGDLDENRSRARAHPCLVEALPASEHLQKVASACGIQVAPRPSLIPAVGIGPSAGLVFDPELRREESGSHTLGPGSVPLPR